jgi:hypothetical protein
MGQTAQRIRYIAKYKKKLLWKSSRPINKVRQECFFLLKIIHTKYTKQLEEGQMKMGWFLEDYNNDFT